MGSAGNGWDGMDRFYRQTIDALVAAAGTRDGTAQGHSDRVRRYARAIATELNNTSPEDLTNLSYAASLHDVGKVAVSGKIINKLGRLTDEEFRIMRQHSLIAARVLEKVEGLRGAIPIIRHHHERYDGRGYPDGLAGEEIPLGARIVAVAETYDILTSDVPWRAALPHETALKEIEQCSGTQFDPTVVGALKNALERLNGQRPN